MSGHEASLSWQLPVVNPGAVQSYQIYYGVVGKTKKQQVSTGVLTAETHKSAVIAVKPS